MSVTVRDETKPWFDQAFNLPLPIPHSELPAKTRATTALASMLGEMSRWPACGSRAIPLSEGARARL
jgi:hypothetical protein